MSALDKEKIFDQLRNYHAVSFPVKSATTEMTSWRERFEEMQDNIINMVLSIISGKSEFVDVSKDLSAFGEKIKSNNSGNELEAPERNLFEVKITQLLLVLDLAKSANFRLRTPARVK